MFRTGLTATKWISWTLGLGPALSEVAVTPPAVAVGSGTCAQAKRRRRSELVSTEILEILIAPGAMAYPGNWMLVKGGVKYGM